MAANFAVFSKITADAFQLAARRELFVVAIDGDKIWQSYLEAFPEGTNLIFKERPEYDCTCCKHFVRRVGNVVSVTSDGAIVTIWDKAAEEAPHPFNKIAEVLRDLVKAAPIAGLFRSKAQEVSFGAQVTRSATPEGGVLTWKHFYTGGIPDSLRSPTPDQVRGHYRTTVQVFERGLSELKPEAIETVLSLIDANNLYRGTEHRPAVAAFQKAQVEYRDKQPEERNVFLWTRANGPAARFRNTVIGTLVQDLSEGVDIERAITSFESKVAPQNYKRSKAIVTPGMVRTAMATIEELGLEPALERRFACIEDISVNDVLWVDSSVKPLMRGGIGDVLMQHAVSTTDTAHDHERAEEISLEDFVANILPGASGLEVLFTTGHLGNLMSLTAPVHPEPKQLFRWDNDFAWSYNGNIADSIKERVKRAGGNVDSAQLRVSLSWFNYDDLDLHVYKKGGSHIYYSSKQGRCGGRLDVDMNVGDRGSREAVENISWTRVPDGEYKVVVHNYTKREDCDVGFALEIENEEKIRHFSYRSAVRDNENIHVLTLRVTDGVVTQYKVGDASVFTTPISQEKWGLQTETYVKVNAVTVSPNYWGDNAVGNKHTFFVIDGAKNDDPTRGIYNEFLHSRLEPHRKVFEVIGEKTKCQPTEGQLSGIGFSSTKRDNVILRVHHGKKHRLFDVQLGT